MQRHLVLYDGDCGLCSGLAAKVSATGAGSELRLRTLRSAEAHRLLERCGLAGDPPDSMLVFPAGRSDRGRPLAKSAAVLFVARRLGWPWRAAGACGILPGRLLDWLYDQVARRRNRLSGSASACALR